MISFHVDTKTTLTIAPRVISLLREQPRWSLEYATIAALAELRVCQFIACKLSEGEKERQEYRKWKRERDFMRSHDSSAWTGRPRR